MSARLRVLVVDDVITNRLLLRKILERENYEIVEAENGLEAINLVQAGGIDIALLDIMMPNMNGIESLEAIRRNFQSKDKKDVKVIIWSNSGSEDTVQKCLAVGVVAFLKKSEYSGNDLVEKVLSLLGK